MADGAFTNEVLCFPLPLALGLADDWLALDPDNHCSSLHAVYLGDPNALQRLAAGFGLALALPHAPERLAALSSQSDYPGCQKKAGRLQTKA